MFLNFTQGYILEFAIFTESIMHLVNPPKQYITIVSNLSLVLQSFQRNKRQWLCKILFFGGGGGVNKVHYGLCENGK